MNGEEKLYAIFWLSLAALLLGLVTAVASYNLSDKQTCSRPAMGGHEYYFCRDWPGPK
jgi:hypothetical protein